MTCKKINNNKYKICISDLSKLITIKTREVTGISGFNYTHNNSFTNEINYYAMIKTVNGITQFDNSNIERVISHKIYIRYVLGITSSNYVEYNSQNYDIIKVENLNEDNNYLLLYCSNIGTSANESNQL